MMKFAVFVLLVGAAMAVKYDVTSEKPPSTTPHDRPVREAVPSKVNIPPPSSDGVKTPPPAIRPRRNANPFGWAIPPPPPMPQFNPNIPLAWQIPPQLQPQQQPPLHPWGSNNNADDHGIQNRWEGVNSWLNDLNLRNSESIFTPIKTSNGQLVWVPQQSPVGPVAQWPQQNGPIIFRSPLHGVYFD